MDKNVLPDESRKELYFKQKKLLDTFLEHGAITKEQYDKSLKDMTEKMGMGDCAENET